jgi:glycosyltransferase involved in cell wall biosynthesis
MRVLFDATYAARAPHSGTGVYTQRILAALEGLSDVELEVVANHGRRRPAGGGLGSARNLLADGRWTAVELPRLARRAAADVIHHPLPAFAVGAAARQVITVHDLAFERVAECFDRGFRLYAHATHRLAARSAAAVLCVSESTAADVEELWRVPVGRIVVAPHGPGQELPSPRRERAHFLYVGDGEPRKNLPTLVDAYRRYRELVSEPLPLVLAGAAFAEGPGFGVEPRPSRGRLAELYASAVALIQPSLYEGFGLTALEAMSAGVSVIASDIPALREVCGEAARYAAPRDPGAFASAMAEIAADARLRQELTARGLTRAAEFSWERCARAHVDAYSLALEQA